MRQVSAILNHRHWLTLKNVQNILFLCLQGIAVQSKEESEVNFLRLFKLHASDESTSCVGFSLAGYRLLGPLKSKVKKFSADTVVSVMNNVLTHTNWFLS